MPVPTILTTDLHIQKNFSYNLKNSFTIHKFHDCECMLQKGKIIKLVPLIVFLHIDNLISTTIRRERNQFYVNSKSLFQFTENFRVKSLT